MKSCELREPVGGLEDLRPARLLDVALAQVVAPDRGLRRDEALGELRLGHLEREQRDRLVARERRVLGEVRHQGRLPHRRAGREDDQVAGLEAARDRVEGLEPRGRPGDRLPLAREVLELVELGRQQVADVHGSPCAGRRARPRGSRARPGPRARAAARRASAPAPGCRRTRAAGGAASRSRARSARSAGRCRPPAPTPPAGPPPPRPPTRSSCPFCLRCSLSVSASTGSPFACRSSIAWKISACASR